MRLTLRTFRLLGEHAMLVNLFLSPQQWRTLCSFDPFGEGEPDALQNLVREVTFRESDEGDVLKVTQLADRKAVYLTMSRETARDEDDVLLVVLSQSEWRRLVTIEPLNDPVISQDGSPLIEHTSETVH